MWQRGSQPRTKEAATNLNFSPGPKKATETGKGNCGHTHRVPPFPVVVLLE